MEEPKTSPGQWLGLVVVHLLIPLVLVVCGGDFGWWQAWLYSTIFMAAGVGGRVWAERVGADFGNTQPMNAVSWEAGLCHWAPVAQAEVIL